MTQPSSPNDLKESAEKPTLYSRLLAWGKEKYAYCSEGVWRDPGKGWKINCVKVLNLSVRSFLSADLQTKACALTYQTLLAVVPMLALLFAIARGFGFQEMIEAELQHYFPSQQKALTMALGFVDSYLGQASEGLFVGVGIVFLLYTLLSLLWNVEASLNMIWKVESGRSLWRKITDYLAIFLVLPVLMVCAGGLSLMMTTTIQSILPYDFMQPAIKCMVDIGSYLFTALFFAGVYLLIPNAKVKVLNALIAGLGVGIAFHLLQWVFLTGQMYVAKYNAIYGSFSFLPLMFIWLQLVWLITLTGAVLCYASQNAGQFSFYRDVEKISFVYRRKVVLAVMAIISKRFVEMKEPLTVSEISVKYGLPIALVREIVNQLLRIKLIVQIEREGEFAESPLQPGVEVAHLTVGEIIRRLQTDGSNDFIPDFSERFGAVNALAIKLTDAMIDLADETNIISINIDI